jgi:hypothetical protein
MSPLGVTGKESNPEPNLAAERRANHLKTPFSDHLVSIWISVFFLSSTLINFLMHTAWLLIYTVKPALQYNSLCLFQSLAYHVYLFACLSSY